MPGGQQAAKLYQFDATTYDWAELTITTVLRDSDFRSHRLTSTTSTRRSRLSPCAEASSGALVAGLIGMNQQAINNRVYQGAIGNFRERIPAEAMEEGLERHRG